MTPTIAATPPAFASDERSVAYVGNPRTPAQSGQRRPTGVRTAHIGQIGVPQREHRRRVGVFGWRAQGTSPLEKTGPVSMVIGSRSHSGHHIPWLRAYVTAEPGETGLPPRMPESRTRGGRFAGASATAPGSTEPATRDRAGARLSVDV